MTDASSRYVREILLWLVVVLMLESTQRSPMLIHFVQQWVVFIQPIS